MTCHFTFILLCYFWLSSQKENGIAHWDIVGSNPGERGQFSTVQPDICLRFDSLSAIKRPNHDVFLTILFLSNHLFFFSFLFYITIHYTLFSASEHPQTPQTRPTSQLRGLEGERGGKRRASEERGRILTA